MNCDLCKTGLATGAIGYTKRVYGRDEQGRKTTNFEWEMAVDVCDDCRVRTIAPIIQRKNNVATGLIADVCPHGGIHALYCAGCCAQFDPGRMVLVHEQRCQFRGHERAP